MGKAFIPLMRKPAANIMIPPKAVKSASIVGVVRGMIEVALENNIINTTNWGIAMSATKNPKVVAKMPAVKKSNMDFVSNIV